MSILEDNARILLAPDSAPGELLGAVRDLHRAFAEITGIHDLSEGTGDAEATALVAGTAISPRDAARCLLDFARTTRFLRGISAAVDEASRRFPNTRIEVLYAGCGPWAPLVLPLCTAIERDRVGFTLLDIHERSLTAVRRLVEHFEIEPWIAGYILGDATTLRLESTPHVIVTETMQRALSKEPQLAVTANLAPQLAEGGIFVPERIRVDACLADVQVEFAAQPESHIADGSARDRIALGTLLDLTPATAGALLAKARGGELPPMQFVVPELPESGEHSLMLLTEVAIYGEEVLGDYDSGITYPEVINDLGLFRSGEEIEIRYRTKEHPGFVSRKQSPPILREPRPDDQLAILALNLESEHLLSPMNGERLGEILAMGGYHRVIEHDGSVVAFLIALEPGVAYDSENYRWFDEDRDAFLYVDRIVVSAQHRGRGFASALYDDLFAFARETGIPEIVCEFNVDPPNPASRAFHASYGFREVGTQTTEDRVVSMQVSELRAR